MLYLCIYILPTCIVLDLSESHFIELAYFLFLCPLEIKKKETVEKKDTEQI